LIYNIYKPLNIKISYTAKPALLIATPGLAYQIIW